MLELPKFGHMNKSTKELESCNKILFMDKIYDIIAFFSKYINLKKPGLANFTGIIKFSTIILNCNFYLYLRYNKNC